MALTRTTDHNEELTVDLGFAEALASVVAAYQKVGKVKSIQEKFGRVVGSVGSGTLNMNKATVTVIVEQIDNSRSKVSFKASAQEGLIQQNTAAKAVTRILDAL
ncbi:MAG: hypothetical protein WAM97_10320 [Acidimicrobiales bacterium]